MIVLLELAAFRQCYCNCGSFAGMGLHDEPSSEFYRKLLSTVSHSLIAVKKLLSSESKSTSVYSD